MKIGVMSDTHGNIVLMQEVADKMILRHGVDAIVHLGDDLADAKLLDARGAKLFAVPGIYEAAWDDKNIPHRIIKEFEGVVFLISHTPDRPENERRGDINPRHAHSKFGAHVLLHGHTHKACAIRPPRRRRPYHNKSRAPQGPPRSKLSGKLCNIGCKQGRSQGRYFRT